MQAKTSGSTNLRVVYLTTPKCLDSQKSKFSKITRGNSKNLKANMRTKNDSLILKTTFWVLANQISFFENYS